MSKFAVVDFATQIYQIPFFTKLRFKTLGSLILGIKSYVIITEYLRHLFVNALFVIWDSC